MKRLPILFGCLAVLAAILVVPIAAQEIKEEAVTWNQVAVADGEALYAELCAVCHGADGRGAGPAVPALKTLPPDLTRLTATQGGVFPTEQVRQAITGEAAITAHGTADMPMWGKVFEDVRPDFKMAHRKGFARLRVYNLTRYLESLQAVE